MPWIRRACLLTTAVVVLVFITKHGILRQSRNESLSIEVSSTSLSPGVAVPYSTSNQSFGTFPQPQVSSGVRLLRFSESGVAMLHHFCARTTPFTRQRLKTPVGDTPIYIHDIKDDKWISANIRNYGKWEYRNVQIIVNLLRKDPNLGFLDIGAHIGVFSLSVAKTGRRVVSVDPVIQNVKRLCKSAQQGDLSDRITIVMNPISDRHEVVCLRSQPGNLSGTKVIPANWTSSTNYSCPRTDKSYSITLDDLIPLVPFTAAVIKVDVQNHEYLVIKGGEKFLHQIEVPAILMEWELIKNSVHGRDLVNLLSGYNYSAYSPHIMERRLDPDAFLNWPVDVVWLKDK